MRATRPLILRIFVKADQAGDVDRLAETARARADAMGLADVALHDGPNGPVIEIFGEEATLRRFWSEARDLAEMGLMTLQEA